MADQVSFLCKRTVISTKTVEQGKLYSLSILDRIMEHNHLSIVLYYNSPSGLKDGDLTKQLRESISTMLCAFPKITGRLIKSQEGEWMIKSNDAGVRMVEARAKGSIDEWLQNVTREKERKLVYWESMLENPYYWSTFYVQLTEFEEGGLALGLSCTHLLADTTCATMFIKAWADTTLTGKIVTPPLFHPLPSRKPGTKITQLINHYKNIKNNQPPAFRSKHKTISLQFNDETVRSCINMAKDPNASDSEDPTPFEALAGLLWVCISRVKGMRGCLTEMSLCFDTRKVLHLDKGFFGNCMVYNKVNSESLSEHELSKATIAIRETGREMDHDGIHDLIGWLEDNDFENPPKMSGSGVICANMEEVEAYSAIFGDGFKTIRASYYIEPALGEGNVLILPSPSGEGSLSRTVMVTLPGDEVIKLLELEIIQEISPIVLMGADYDN